MLDQKYFVVAEELLVKSIQFLRLIHQTNQPFNLHTAVAELIQAIESTAKPHDLPQPQETKGE